jgi:iron complex transport system permease protein
VTLTDTRPETRTPPRTPSRRALTGLVVLVALMVVAAVLSLAVGSRSIDPGTVVRVLFSPDGSDESVIVHELRIPRTIVGVLVGLALGAAGALMQGHTRNPLADPGLLGVAAGASFAVVLAISVFGVGSLSGYVWFAIVGAAIASVVVFAIGSAGGKGPTPLNLVLAGAAVAALLDSFTSSVIVREQDTLDEYRFWVVGSLAGRDMEVAAQVAPFIVVGLVVALAHAPALNVLSLGEDVARALGQRVGLSRAIGLAAIMLLTGAATAACGPIAFLGLVVPHIARHFTGPDHRWLVPYAAAMGAVLILVADVIGRVVARPGELQVGIVLAVIGAPFFIALIRRRRLVSL